MTLRVGQYTAVFTGHDGSHRTGVAVCAGRGTVCQKPTLSIPVENPKQVGMVLGMGLMIRDIMGVLQIEPGEYPPGVPAWVITSPLNTIEFVNVLLENAPVLERLNTR